ncbi:dTDP-4-dehydrorhamnose 3,5-epimerase [Longimonas halophila]|uniref:dTDP-4-dehydrorhamnose 3,5-epimerase n=1 Tax=Longimonas halophila TaxID=1469170 RepID=A0A2H3NSP9_9BACT|nr:dTDP-4-dehydrorhamnose 3,5-epimerase [Longimonas halophila]PEN09256.1 dTDP-4-dehydrorhamnose 3,5-epimerase [Longimonas halophila]
MTVTPTAIPAVRCIETTRYPDERGFFREVWRASRYQEADIAGPFVQDNVSRSRPGVVRGLHYQHPHGQGKLIDVWAGRIYDIAVDIRQGSPTFGEHVAVQLDAEAGRQLYIPPGFAHGFAVVGATDALVAYKCTDEYAPDCEHTIRWNDPALGIDWPVDTPVLSASDRDAPRLADLAEAALPVFNT